EGIEIKVNDASLTGDIEYCTHIQSIGWENDWKKNGEMSGTSGRSLRLEAIKIRLTGELADKYDVYYRVHVQTVGWLDWAKNGEKAGSAGFSYRLEGIEIQLVEKGGAAPGSTSNPYVHPMVKYRTHVQSVGWQDFVGDGAVSGTTGRSLRLEGIEIILPEADYEGGLQYRTHVQSIGWQDWVNTGEMSGTSGRALRLEAIEIKLTGEMSEHYDIYYRVHCQNFGWMGWAKNGESSGSAGYSYRLEGIEICLVEKGGVAPGSTNGAFISR
ncbi:MAG: hypothetical protein HUJ75_08050, partial [Parasporobacterium sp.]|nr:hypothetical protein [Parasporobacterium sp.]